MFFFQLKNITQLRPNKLIHYERNSSGILPCFLFVETANNFLLVTMGLLSGKWWPFNSLEINRASSALCLLVSLHSFLCVCALSSSFLIYLLRMWHLLINRIKRLQHEGLSWNLLKCFFFSSLSLRHYFKHMHSNSLSDMSASSLYIFHGSGSSCVNTQAHATMQEQ